MRIIDRINKIKRLRVRRATAVRQHRAVSFIDAKLVTFVAQQLRYETRQERREAR